jgi:hypothetical protein
VNFEFALDACGENEKQILFKDLMGEDRYDRNLGEIRSKGLYLDLPMWRYHIFEIIG